MGQAGVLRLLDGGGRSNRQHVTEHLVRTLLMQTLSDGNASASSLLGGTTETGVGTLALAESGYFEHGVTGQQGMPAFHSSSLSLSSSAVSENEDEKEDEGDL